MLLEKESSTSRRVSCSKILIQPKVDPSYSVFFVVVFNLLELGELFFFLSALNTGFLEGVGEGRASGHYMSAFAAAETKSFLDALFSFFRRELLWKFDHVNVHSIGVFGCSGGRGKRLEGLSSPSTSLSDLLSAIPLVLEVDGFQVLVVNFIWDCIKGHDLLHEQGGDSSSKEADVDVVVSDAGTGGVTLECQDITFESGGELPILLDHAVGGQPGDSIPGHILVFESLLELFRKLSQVPRVTVVLLMAFSWKVSAHVRTDPSVM